MAERTFSYFSAEGVEVGLYRETEWGILGPRGRVVGSDGAASGEPESRDSEAYMWPEVGRQLAACGWVIYRMELDCPGGWWKVGASEVSLAWGLCESLCLCLTHPLSLKAALVCWCLRSCHMRGPG